jgi:3-oxoacyl-[acyl-carrier protein] reductase
LGRIPTPEDFAHAAVFLASQEASAITGHMLMVDCGASAGKF